MTKLKAIKSIEDFKEYNIICTTTEEVKECLEILNTREETKNPVVYKEERIVVYNKYYGKYVSRISAKDDKNDISFYHLKKAYNRLKKQQEQEEQKLPDFETDENGRVIKINNWNSDKALYFLNLTFIDNCEKIYVKKKGKDYIENIINLGLCFISKEALDNYLKYLTIHTQLKNLANRLNNGENIGWNNFIQCKFCLTYNYLYNEIHTFELNKNKDKNIYCLDKNFKDEALKEIGEENLKWYLQQSY